MEYNYRKNSLAKTRYSYYPNGNTYQKTTSVGLDLNGSGTPVEKTVFTYESYATSCSGQATHIPSRVIETRSRNNTTVPTPDITREQYDSYTSDLNLQFSHRLYGSSEEVTTTYTNFNAFGLPGLEVLSATGLANRQKSYEYDATGRFVTKVTDINGHSEQHSYDPLWGRPDTVTAVDGLTATYTYDEFGRLASETDPYGTTRTTSYAWDALSGPGTNATEADNACYHTLLSDPCGADREVYYDYKGRERQVREQGFDGAWVNEVTSYYHDGNVRTVTNRFAGLPDTVVSTYVYDNELRIDQVTNPLTGTVDYTYGYGPQRHWVKTATPSTWSKKTYDAAGKVIHAEDEGGTLDYYYDANDHPIEVRMGTTVLDRMEYNLRGQRTKLEDLSAGTIDYAYNAYGELVKQVYGPDTTTLTYNALGQVVQKKVQGTQNPVTIDYTYVTTGNGLYQVDNVELTSGAKKSFTYDAYNRVQEVSISDTDYDWGFQCTFAYDDCGRLAQKHFETGVGFVYQYNAHGYRNEIRAFDDGNPANSITVYKALSANAYGQAESYLLGNGLTSSEAYNALGMPDTFYTPGIQHLHYLWDVPTGQLDDRNDLANGLYEHFQYEPNTDRLAESQVLGLPPLAMNYSANGNFTDKSDAGAYEFQTASPYRLQKIGNPGGETIHKEGNQEVKYTAFNEPESVTQYDNTAGTDWKVDFTYGPDLARIEAEFRENGTLAETRSYWHEQGYERVEDHATGIRHHIYYVHGNGRLNAMIVKEEQNNSGTFSTPQSQGFKYVYTDPQGSILTVTDNTGSVEWAQNFDAWGRDRYPANWKYVGRDTLMGAGPLAPYRPVWLIRGYTGHEMLDRFQLVHMNGRLYSPLSGRMLAPDNNVQFPHNTQGYNRYAYALNNPLKYTDPSGESLAQLAIYLGWVGAKLYHDGYQAHGGDPNPANWDWKNGYYTVGVSRGGRNTTFMAGVGWHQGDQVLLGYNTGTGHVGGGYRYGNRIYYGDFKQTQTSSAGIDWSNVEAQRGYSPEYHQFGAGPSRMDPFYEGGPAVASTDPMDGAPAQTDYRANLLKSETPIQDIFTAIHVAQSSGNLTNLYDVVVPNDYGSNWSVYNNYSEVLTVSGHGYKLRVHGYSSDLPESYYNIYQAGFGYLDRFSSYEPSEKYNGGYYQGFFMTGYNRQYFITIGAKTSEDYKYLKELYHAND